MIPGGGVEESERYQECCERELLEETGIKVKRLTDEYLEIRRTFLRIGETLIITSSASI